MAKYLFVYHGGGKPEESEDIPKIMKAWEDWFINMGEMVIDAGNPVGMSTTVNSDGSVTDNGGSNPTSGYSVIQANSIEEAIKNAKSCPILTGNGSIEIAEIIEM